MEDNLEFDDLELEEPEETVVDDDFGFDDFGDFGDFGTETGENEGTDSDSDDFGFDDLLETGVNESENSESESDDFGFDDLLETVSSKSETESDDFNFDDLATESDTSADVGWDDNILDESNSDNISFDESGIEGTEITEVDDTDYTDGVPVSDAELHDSESYESELDSSHSFIDSTGNIKVQVANDDRENGFELTYIDIDKIAITRRIRNLSSVDSLVQSIKSTGLLEPLVVVETETEGLYVLLSGYRRIQACARAGKRRIPCIVNTRVNTTEIPIIEAMYNHSKRYTIKEQIDYIDYLEKEQGILNASMIEYLLQMNSGDYTKLKDILNDNDDDIVSKLYDGTYDISTAFKKLEQRRKKESAEEKENKRASKVYEDEAESGADKIEGSGEEVDGVALTEDQIQSLAFNLNDLDSDSSDDKSLAEMVEETKDLEGFEPYKQDVHNREIVDPAIRTSVMVRDNGTCQCCKKGGVQMANSLDFHHILPVSLGGPDTVDNGVMLCVLCHRQIHLYSTDELEIDPVLINDVKFDDLTDKQKEQYSNEGVFDDEKRRYKNVVQLANVIRKGMAMKGINKRQYKKDNPNTGVGRRKPGAKAEQEIL